MNCKILPIKVELRYTFDMLYSNRLHIKCLVVKCRNKILYTLVSVPYEAFSDLFKSMITPYIKKNLFRKIYNRYFYCSQSPTVKYAVMHLTTNVACTLVLLLTFSGHYRLYIGGQQPNQKRKLASNILVREFKVIPKMSMI